MGSSWVTERGLRPIPAPGNLVNHWMNPVEGEVLDGEFTPPLTQHLPFFSASKQALSVEDIRLQMAGSSMAP